MQKIQNNTIISYLIALPLIFLLTPWIVKAACGKAFPEVILITRVLLVSVLFIAANAFRIQFLLVCGRMDLYAKVHVVAALVGLPLILVLLRLFSFLGAAISTIILEAGIFILTYFIIKNLKLAS